MATILDELITVFGFRTDEAQRRIQGIQDNLNKVPRNFAIAGTAGVAALGIIAKSGLDTESALLKARAALSLNEEQMRRLRIEALKIGAQLPRNTKDIIEAQLAYGKLGASFEEIIRDTPAIAKAAAALEIQPEQVARYAQVVQNVFGGDINTNLDLMLRTANRSPASFVELGESLQFAGQSAADAGLDLKTYLASLGGIAGAGRSVESVAQGLTAMWARLAKSQEGIGRGSEVVSDAFDAVGIDMDRVRIAMSRGEDGFVRLLELINEAGLSTTQLTGLLSTLAGDSYSASLSFAVQNPGAIRELLAEAELAAGETDR